MTLIASRKVLRPYQEEAIEKALQALKEHDSTVIVLPTGLGKTVVMARLASEWDGNVLLLAHRIELLEQAADKLHPELGYKPVIEQGIRGQETHLLYQGGTVVVGSVQTMVNTRRLEKFRSSPFGLIMIDECHHATAASYRKVVDFFRGINPGLKVVGVTATPNRADRKALGIVFGSVALSLGIAEAIRDGWLVDVHQESVVVEGVDFGAVSVGKNELGESDFRASELEAILMQEKILHGMAVPTLNKIGDRQALVFTSGVRHAHELASVLRRYKPDCAAAVDGETLPQERAKLVDQFHRGELQFLCNFGVFTEGFDCPAASVVVMGRPTKSVGLYTQMLGRGTRPLPGVVDGPFDAAQRRARIAASEKPFMLALDFVGNSGHRLVDAVDVLGGVYDEDVAELARERVRQDGGNIEQALEEAAEDLALRREEVRRKHLLAQVQYQADQVNPFDGCGAGGGRVIPKFRGGCSDGQIALLVGLGVREDVAAAYTKRQASAVIDKLGSERCTDRQRRTLIKFGENPNVSIQEASAIIDEIAANGWQRRR